jgi:hypothetical protein
MSTARLPGLFLCSCVLALSLLGCSPDALFGTFHPAYQPPAPPLSGVDWANFTYFSSCYGNTEPFKARKGRARNGHITFEVFPPIFGDLTGDGQQEAALPYRCFAADSGGLQVFVYTGTAAHPRLLGQLPLAGSNGGVVLFNSLTVRIRDGQIQLTGASYSAGAPRCCPDRLLSIWYRWNGSHLVKVRCTNRPL